MTREELTALLHQYAVDYSDYKLEELSGITTKPPVNPVGTILSAINKLEEQSAYWKLSFYKQCAATRTTS